MFSRMLLICKKRKKKKPHSHLCEILLSENIRRDKKTLDDSALDIQLIGST